LVMHFIRMFIFIIFSFNIAFAQHPSPVSHWDFDHDPLRNTRDRVKNIEDEILGYAVYKQGVKGKSLKFDEKSTQIIRVYEKVPDLSGIPEMTSILPKSGSSIGSSTTEYSRPGGSKPWLIDQE